jgi:hypothetical protein
MSESQQDVKQETPSMEDVKEQPSSEDVNDAVPYSRFKEVNSNYKTLKGDYEKLSAKVNDMEESKMISEGKKDDVIANLKGTNAELSKKVGSLEQYVNDERTRLLDAFPEEKRDLYSGVDIVVLRDMASERTELLNKNQKVGVNTSRGGSSMSAPKDFHELSAEEKSDPATWQNYLERFRRK